MISINATLPTLQMLSPTPSQSYLIAARHLSIGAEALSVEPHRTGVACALLAAQTLECALKSYLSYVGVEEKKLKAASLRHNLEALWSMAVQHALDIQTNPPQWCNILNSAHDKPFYFRYPTGLNGVTLPVLATMVADLKVIIGEVEKAVK